MRIYIDTSVINGLYAKDAEITSKTKEFFNSVRKLQATLYCSDVTIEEIEQTPQILKRGQLKKVVENYWIEILATTEEMRTLGNQYVKQGIIPKKYLADALHIAIATVYNIPVLVSWNFEHMVKLKTKIEVNRINQENNYPQINIISPLEV